MQCIFVIIIVYFYINKLFAAHTLYLVFQNNFFECHVVQWNRIGVNIMSTQLLLNIYWNVIDWLEITLKLTSLIPSLLAIYFLHVGNWPQSCSRIFCLWQRLMVVVFFDALVSVRFIGWWGQCEAYVRVHALEFHTDHWLLRLFWCPSSQQAPGGVRQLRRGRFRPRESGSDRPGPRFSTSQPPQPSQWVRGHFHWN